MGSNGKGFSFLETGDRAAKLNSKRLGELE